MCAIIDADAIGGLFKPGSPGYFLLSGVAGRKIKIAVGGQKLKCEYRKAGFDKWIVEAIRAGFVRLEEDKKVDALAAQLSADRRIVSDDHHIIALAQISGARLLHSYDNDLRDDFKKKSVIDNPRGDIYARSRAETLRKKHRDLLRKRLCPR